MFDRIKLKLARRHDVKPVVKLFSLINNKINPKEIREMIENKKVYVLKGRKKKVLAAFSYTIIGIIGFFAIMYIGNLAVSPESHGRGIGTFLLSRIKLICSRAGVTAFCLFSVYKVKRFYERNQLNGIWRFFWWRGRITDKLV